ncbi:hypothetical protein CSAL01_02317 [Colletotrichum salicis]|uniref:Uncharacterized protein n=1 Tax=Colletotrichum salicis TaxID=1209931 RepID=A0A135V2R0_9PEZI|nr:hypothetical protein CSAL01_02317 [Colletotrichum salicis]
MGFLTLFPLLSLLSLVTALPVLETQEAAKFRYPWKDFTLSNLESVCRKQNGDERYTCTIKYVVEVSGAHCGTAWQWDGVTPNQGPDNNYPSNGVLCWSAGSDAFQFRVARFRSASNFELYINHFYRDTR